MKIINHKNVGYILNQLIEIRYSVRDAKNIPVETTLKINKYLDNIITFILED